MFRLHKRRGFIFYIANSLPLFYMRPPPCPHPSPEINWYVQGCSLCKTRNNPIMTFLCAHFYVFFQCDQNLSYFLWGWGRVERGKGNHVKYNMLLITTNTLHYILTVFLFIAVKSLIYCRPLIVSAYTTIQWTLIYNTVVVTQFLNIIFAIPEILIKLGCSEMLEVEWTI